MIHRMTLIIFGVMNLSLVEARFFIETEGRLDKPENDAIFLYKCTKALAPDRVRVALNCVPITESWEKNEVYLNANFYEVWNGIWWPDHFLTINGEETHTYKSHFLVGYLPLIDSIPNPDSKKSKKKKGLPSNDPHPEINEFPIIQMMDSDYENCEERVGRIGTPKFTPIANIEAMHDLSTVFGINDVAVFWNLRFGNGLNNQRFFTFMILLNEIVKAYFDEVRRTPKMIKKKIYSDYVVPIGKTNLTPKEKWQQGVKDIQQAVKYTMNKLIDPCAIRDVTSRTGSGEFFTDPEANNHCILYCKFLKAGFLVYGFFEECSTIIEEKGTCRDSVCTCYGVANKLGNMCFKRQTKTKPLRMHYCNNILRLKITTLNIIERKKKNALKVKSFRKHSGDGGETVPWPKMNYEYPSMYSSPGSSPRSDPNTAESYPENHWEG